uniref:Potassium transporter 10-like isoform X1 n=1 Tax=Tanacetum cinerariifolium TaxID=118510 RepID=A0A6L2LKG8_TANCI|nr:potassium transporter 10-like isoform X1 [Tanacetum cinerariifolium]
MNVEAELDQLDEKNKLEIEIKVHVPFSARMFNRKFIIHPSTIETEVYGISVTRDRRSSVVVVHTSKKFHGQIYVPDINWILVVLCIIVTVGFKNQSQIGNLMVHVVRDLNFFS